MKKIAFILLVISFAAFTFTACESNSDKGTVVLSITDAPIDSELVKGVYITISDIQYHISGNNFESFPDFEGPKTFNLLDLTRGVSELLGELELEAGTYTQIRFMLDAPEYGSTDLNNPGCYIEFTDETTEALFVPSGSQSGFKGVGAFTVPMNGSVEVTADFDVRKSVVATGSGKYILKPTIRLVVDNQAGQIAGAVTNIPENTEIVIFSYEEGSYTLDEASEPAEETPRFPNAISNDKVDETGQYKLAFLAPMTYELVVAAYVDGEFVEVLGIVENVLVESKKTTSQSIDISSLN